MILSALVTLAFVATLLWMSGRSLARHGTSTADRPTDDRDRALESAPPTAFLHVAWPTAVPRRVGHPGRAVGPTACLVRSRAASKARRVAAGSDRSARAVSTGRIRKLGCSTQVGT